MWTNAYQAFKKELAWAVDKRFQLISTIMLLKQLATIRR